VSSIHETLGRDGLIRPVHGRVLGGVCAGLGRRFGLDPWPARLLFLLVLMVIPGSQLIVYPVLWILMPSEDKLARAHGGYPAPGAPVPPAA
jgi:phage shock protein C